jgi:uncharacterized protein YukE
MTLGTATDQVLADLTELLDSAVDLTDKAHSILDTFDDLSNFSETLNNSLTTAAKAGFEQLWVNWSASLLGMAKYLEAIGLLLNNGAVHYMNTDNNITTAFGGHPDTKQHLQDDIDHVKNNDDGVQKKLTDDVKKVDDLKKKADADKTNYDNTDQIVHYNEYGEPIYESKKYPGDTYILGENNKQIWLGLAHQHEQYLPMTHNPHKKDDLDKISDGIQDFFSGGLNSKPKPSSIPGARGSR